jgi:NAD(P)-dependent dehydrogenase (short-subunit alcohol dehydrogenase family)
MQNKTVVVTGAFGTLGQAAAKRALDLGARVALVDIAATAPADLMAAGGDRALALGGVDLTDAASVGGALRTVAETFGGIDVLLNIAGGFAWETVADGALDTWDKMYTANVRTTITTIKAALPFLEKSAAGAIVNVSAAAIAKAGLGMAPYAASKAGVAKLTESLAEEYKGRITVNAVLPTIIDTPPNRAAMPDADPSQWVPPASLAATMLFLAGERSITGALLPVAGAV